METKVQKNSVLVVEDDQGIGEMLKIYLGKSGFAVRIAPDAEQAKQLFAEAPPQVMLVDIALPGQSGIDMVRDLRQTPAGNKMPVVLMSAVFNTSRHDPVARELNIAAFLSKPLTLRDVVKTLERVLAGSGVESEPEPQGEFGPIAGALTTRRLAQVLVDLHDARRSGFLRARHGDDEMTVTVVRGIPVNTRCNLRQHTLSNYVVEVGRLSEQQVATIDKVMTERNQRFGEAAVACGLLTPAEAVQLLEKLVFSRLAALSTWSEGSIHFTDAQEQAETDGLTELDPFEAILSGYLKHSSVTEAVATLSAGRHRFIQVTPRFQLYRAYYEKLVPSTPLPAVLVRAPRVDDLMRDLQSAGTTVLTQLHALLAADMVTLVDTPSRTAAGPRESLDAHLVLRPSARLVEVDHQAEEREVQAEYLRCQGASYYRILEASPDASSAELLEAANAKLTHLARLDAALDTPKVRARLHAVHSWVDTALDVLSDPERRKAYDDERTLKIHAPAGFHSPEAEEAFRRGREALGAGDLDLAVAALDRAAELCPQDPDYIATLGWAETRRAKIENIRGLERLKTVCARNPHAARAHMFFGLVAEERGQIDAARKSLRQALQTDPKLGPARQALERLGEAEQDLYDFLFETD